MTNYLDRRVFLKSVPVFLGSFTLTPQMMQQLAPEGRVVSQCVCWLPKAMTPEEYTSAASEWQDQAGIEGIIREFTAQGKITGGDLTFHGGHLQWTVEYANRAAFEECLPKIATHYQERTRIARGFRASLTVVQNGNVIFQKSDPA